MNEVFTRPAVQVGVDWISNAMTFAADDLKEFRAVRAQFKKLQDLKSKLHAELKNLRSLEKDAHQNLAIEPSQQTIATAEQARRAVSLAAEELPRSEKHLQNSLDELVRNRLVPVAVKLNTAIFDFLIAESKAVEANEQSLTKRYQASEYVPSELVKALVWRASRFHTAAQHIEKANLGARNLTPDSALDGVIVPESK
jgi:hypothetical protein